MNSPTRFTALVLGLSAPLALTAPAFAQGDSGNFAVISPAVAAKLATLSGTPEAQAVIRDAGNGLVDTPDAIPRVHTEGTLPHQGIWDESIKASRDWDIMESLGLAWRLTGDQRYLTAESQYLTAWFNTYQVSYNPIDETNFDQVIFAFDLTRAGLSPDVRNQGIAYFQAMSGGYLDKIEALEHKDNANWQSHRIKLAVLTAYETGDDGLLKRARHQFWHQVGVNIRPDGSVEDFYKRDALHYTVYDLEPLTVTAIAAKEHGEDWFHQGDKNPPSLQGAMDWLKPYTLEQQTHEEFVHSTVAFDAQRAAAGLKGYSGPWDPGTAVLLYQQATVLDPSYGATLSALLTETPKKERNSFKLLAEAGL